MNHDWSPADIDNAPDVSAHLARLLDDEPPFRQSLAEATIAAVHGGRRRRARVRAVGVVMTGAVAAGVGAAVIVTGPFGSTPTSSVATGPVSSAAPAPPASAAPASTAPAATTSAAPSTPPAPVTESPSGSPSETPGTAPVGPVGDRVTRLALAAAKPLGAATVIEQSAPRAGDATTPYLTALRVRTPSGDLEVRVSLDADPGTSVALLTESCRLDNGGKDSGRRCTPISLTGDAGTWSRAYPNQPGRATLELAATTAEGRTLHLVIDNYTASPSGTKTIGPSWSALGIDPTTVENLVRDSGLVN